MSFIIITLIYSFARVFFSEGLEGKKSVFITPLKKIWYEANSTYPKK